MGAQKTYLHETVFLSTYYISLGLEIILLKVYLKWSWDEKY